MELTEDQKKRRQGFLDWDAEERLPASVGDFHFKRIDKQEGRIYYAFAYVSESTGWEVRALFDEETMDYMVKTDFRLFVMTDIDLISSDFEAYKKAVETLLVPHMTKELIQREEVSVIVRGKAFTVWDYSEVLPPEIGPYRRIIEPAKPLLGLNGSYIIAVYEWQEKERGMIFFYNMFRDEYYAEKSAETIPIIIHDYDSKTIKELEEKIRKHLSKDLEKLKTEKPE